jgi:DNA-binding MarR family transcriptional regulator
MSPGELSDALLLTTGGLSNLLRRMEADGYVQRSPDKRDKRGVVVQLTAKGIAKADASMADHAETERALVACLTNDDQKNVARALGLMIATSTAR